MKRICITIAAALLAGCAATTEQAPAEHWVGAWVSAQQTPEPHNAFDPADLTDATLRQVLRVSIGGSRLRVRLSNRFGTEPMRIAGAHLARSLGAGAPAIDTASDTPLLFSGRAEVLIPAGADYWSDPLDFAVEAGADLAVTIYFTAPPVQQTGHPGSRTTSFFIHGAHLADADLPGAKTVAHWAQLSGVDVRAPGGEAIVVIGDSITDGRGSTTDGNDRWPDFLAQRLQQNPGTRHVAVLNQGIGGNRLLLDGLGPSAMARFERDVLAQSAVRYLIVLEGVNDLGTLTRDGEVSQAAHRDLVARIIGAYEQMIAKAHGNGVRVFGATILPYCGGEVYRCDAVTEADRQAVNDWIRHSGAFDAVLDFDAALRDPEHPDQLRPEFDSGDKLHPSPAGFRAMAQAVPLDLFTD